MDLDRPVEGTLLDDGFSAAVGPVHDARPVTHEAVVREKPSRAAMTSTIAPSLVRFRRGVPTSSSHPLVPEMLAVERVLGVDAQLMGVDARNGDGLRSVGSDAPYLCQVGVEDVSCAVLHDADAGMRDRRRTDGRDEQHEEESTGSRDVH